MFTAQFYRVFVFIVYFLFYFIFWNNIINYLNQYQINGLFVNLYTCLSCCVAN